MIDWKPLLKKWAMRSPIVRSVGAALIRTCEAGRSYKWNHLYFYREENVLGDLQRDEALFLFALARVLRPRTVVEFGFLRGHSTFNLLQSVSPDCNVFSYDIEPSSQEIAKSQFARFPNFHFILKSQTDFSRDDINRAVVDLCFLDASHDFELNKVTFTKLIESVSDESVIVVHDTGTWAKSFFKPLNQSYAVNNPEGWLGESEFQHCRGERQFVNWVLDLHPEFQEIHLHSTRTLRNGFTMLQRRHKLRTD